jgi:hypothetical protein
MLCGRCKKPLLCKVCGETENSQTAPWNHKFDPEECEDCKDDPTYLKKDVMWYFKSITEAIQVFIGCICLIGFVVGMLLVLVSIPFVWGKPISYQPFPWLGVVMSWSISVGLVNGLFILSRDNRWREDYIDHSMIINIREKGAKHESKKMVY